MPNPIRAAVFPVAGLGTRFLPATKATPKEMLPIVDKPLIQYAVEEAIAAGATKLVFITSESKQAIENHFSPDVQLENSLQDPGKAELLESIKSIVPENASCEFVIQGEPLGLGHAVLCARQAVGNEPFFVHLCDDLIQGEPCLREMVGEYERHGSSVVAVEEVPHESTSSYGIVATDESESGRRMTSIVEKPKPEEAPSNLAVVGRYLLAPEIFDKLENTGRGAGGEIQLTDAIADLLIDADVFAFSFSGTRYDCGSKFGYLQATIAYGLAHDDIGEEFRSHLMKVIDSQ